MTESNDELTRKTDTKNYVRINKAVVIECCPDKIFIMEIAQNSHSELPRSHKIPFSLRQYVSEQAA